MTTGKERLSAVKEHLKEHKELYIGLSIGLGIGIVGGLFFRTKVITIVDAFNFKWKSPSNNYVISQLVRAGHPGNVVRCVETGVVFPSQNQAAKALGINKALVSNQINGLIPTAQGYTFEFLGEAV